MTRCVIGCLLGLVVAGPGLGEEKTWLTDWSKAREAAREQGKPLFVVFR
jgi:hypothetical protein